MDFALSEDLTLLRDMARDFADKELAPRAARHDREAEIDPVVWRKLAELGFMGLVVPEEYGGTGLSATWPWPSCSRRSTAAARRPA